MPGERRRLVTDALHEVAVTADPEDVVVAQLGAEARAEVLLVDRHADGVRKALPQRAGRDLDALRVPVLRVPRCARAELPELTDVVELETVTGEVEHRVEQHRRVARREHETVPIGPVGIGRVVFHDARPEHVRERRQGHRRPRVTGIGLLHGIHREPTNHVDRALVELVSHVGPFLTTPVRLGVTQFRPAPDHRRRRRDGETPLSLEDEQ